MPVNFKRHLESRRVDLVDSMHQNHLIPETIVRFVFFIKITWLWRQTTHGLTASIKPTITKQIPSRAHYTMQYISLRNVPSLRYIFFFCDGFRLDWLGPKHMELMERSSQKKCFDQGLGRIWKWGGQFETPPTKASNSSRHFFQFDLFYCLPPKRRAVQKRTKNFCVYYLGRGLT